MYRTLYHVFIQYVCILIQISLNQVTRHTYGSRLCMFYKFFESYNQWKPCYSIVIFIIYFNCAVTALFRAIDMAVPCLTNDACMEKLLLLRYSWPLKSVSAIADRVMFSYYAKNIYHTDHQKCWNEFNVSHFILTTPSHLFVMYNSLCHMKWRSKIICWLGLNI